MASWRENVSDDTMLDKLQLINNNKKSLTDNRNFNLKVTIISGSLLAVYAFLFIRNHPNENILIITVDFFGNAYHLLWLLTTTVFFFMHIYYQTRIDQEKNSLEKLRLETIDHLKNTWYINEHSHIRDQISRDMEKQGINVRFKNG
ncbi:DUF2663 family protein [Lentibacillus sp. Marseille-P4043]|uniref:DUF2663 family protein n=1 Tax=Lentibacillus sp. Marseille-P4043 TaxID=2040293 RepID=UPI000D0BD37A|nr:DUF2663 family protein [Lentibacillus sp. Marseille-P4043]